MRYISSNDIGGIFQMNKIILMGRLVKNPELRYSNSENPIAIVNYTLAVDRQWKKDGEQNTDFINCVAFNKAAEFADKYFSKGMRVCVSGRLQIDSYKNKEDKTVYKAYVILDSQEFAQSKNETKENSDSKPKENSEDDYLPF